MDESPYKAYRPFSDENRTEPSDRGINNWTTDPMDSPPKSSSESLPGFYDPKYDQSEKGVKYSVDYPNDPDRFEFQVPYALKAAFKGFLLFLGLLLLLFFEKLPFFFIRMFTK